MQKLSQLYLQRQEQFNKISTDLNKKYGQYSYIRMLFFLVSAAVIIYLWTLDYRLGMAALAVLLVAFYQFVRWHQAIQVAADHNERLAKINTQENGALAHDFQCFASGEEFLDLQHPFALDLDIFGSHSFFQYCNRTTSLIGRQKLADYLLEESTKEEIEQRHGALKELKERLDWRQEFQALGLETEDDVSHLQALKKWLTDESFVLNNKWLKMALIAVPTWVAIGIFLWIYYISTLSFLLWMAPVVYILKKTLEQVNNIHRRTSHAEQMLSHYARLIKHIETASFDSPKLKALHQNFSEKEKTASSRIARLSYIIGQLNVRYNAFAFILNIMALWDLQWINQLEKWKQAEKERLPKWFEALAQFEALSSFANLYFNNPNWVLPEIDTKGLFSAEELGHPLIHVKDRVNNDIDIPLDGHIKLVTGSNMAGKSTFLRTIGLNIILAQAGAPVCAKKLTSPLMKVYTSMRTQDALHESTSSFYAELKRLKLIIEAVEEKTVQSTPVFFLLDEILKGTNSVDRHTGSKALIRQLIQSKGSGIIATHDLELGALEKNYGGSVENLCIEVEIKDDKLFFDYKLKKGVSKSFNATLLMKSMGIRIEG